ncbi:MAG: peptide chain release factor N(5)-glutamine methyltransferase [Bacteroidetes bacterium]|jgi:release factor glutamine methyltransferase|nr:peptide chain release factor N(5)-glutamine methyltransferase [Bacteroidota bacterium]
MTFEAAEQSLATALDGLYENREAATIAGMVMEFVTGKSKMDRWLQKNELLSIEDLKRLEKYSNELLTGKPVQYVLGQAWFAGMCLAVNEHTLIPRPETEELVNLCASWAATNKIQIAPLQILEVGTGSGCIAIALQQKMPAAIITAIDISAEAIEVATINAAKYNAPIQFKTFDFLNEARWPEMGNYDIIISNPPYIADIEKESMAGHVLNFEPHTALFVRDNDPLIFYSALANFGNKYLHKDGALFVEINQALGIQTQDVFEQKNYTTLLKKDLFENDRMIEATKL